MAEYVAYIKVYITFEQLIFFDKKLTSNLLLIRFTDDKRLLRILT